MEVYRKWIIENSFKNPIVMSCLVGLIVSITMVSPLICMNSLCFQTKRLVNDLLQLSIFTMGKFFLMSILTPNESCDITSMVFLFRVARILLLMLMKFNVRSTALMIPYMFWMIQQIQNSSRINGIVIPQIFLRRNKIAQRFQRRVNRRGRTTC